MDPARASAIKQQLVRLIQEGLDSEDGEDVTDEWWERKEKELDDLRAFVRGDNSALLKWPGLVKALSQHFGLEPLEKNEAYWDAMRKRLLTEPPPGIYV